ncbi:MAG: DUF1573 domain-containing protein [Planctomycetaceae bacterium]
MRLIGSTGVLLLLGLAPFVAALVAEVHEPDLHEPIARRELSPFMLRQHAVNLGPVGPYPLIEGHFDFRNNGRSPLTIQEIKPSCGCLKWHLHQDQQTFAPGEPGRLTVRLMTANEDPGPHGYSVDITWNDGEEHVSTVIFRATLPERKLVLAPHELIFMQMHGAADERTIHVTDYRTKSAESTLELLEVASTSSDVTAEILPMEIDEAGHRRIPIRVEVPAEVTPGRQLASLRIKTNDDVFPILGLPVLIEGRVRTYGPTLPTIENLPPLAFRWPGYPLDVSPLPARRPAVQQVTHETVIR